MRTDDFDRHIMEELSQIPPAELPRFSPWRPAMDRIVVGTALLTFRFQFFYLQYLLPLLGAVLVYLGYRSLRLENRWFRLGWLLSALLLASHMALDVLAATPVMAMLAASPAVDGTLTWLLQGASLLMLLALWRGTRAVFLSSGTENLPRDWLGQGLLCHLLALAVALWDQLVPASQPGLLGLSITNEWLYYGRPIFMILLELRFLICIYRQSETLSGFGYHISPVPVRLSSRTVLAGTLPPSSSPCPSRYGSVDISQLPANLPRSSPRSRRLSRPSWSLWGCRRTLPLHWMPRNWSGVRTLRQYQGSSGMIQRGLGRRRTPPFLLKL